jgi:Kef-type K+ transport system membrane component KefB
MEGILPALARFGMVLLFFIAGLEIEFHAIRGRPLVFAVLG